MSYIYALILEDNKYYVGKTDNPELRIEQHHEGSGATWTIKYKPINILFIKKSNSPFDENNTTKELMIKYGINNVRGGSYCSEYIDNKEKELLQKELWGVDNCCIRCGYKDHYINQCRKRIDVNGNKIILKSIAKKIKKDKVKNVKDNVNNNINNNKCKKCGRNNHKAKDCFATTKLTGSPILKKVCKKCGRSNHKTKDCYATTKITGETIKK